jgi:hypothetical protein
MQRRNYIEAEGLEWIAMKLLPSHEAKPDLEDGRWHRAKISLPHLHSRRLQPLWPSIPAYILIRYVQKPHEEKADEGWGTTDDTFGTMS